MDAGDLLLLDAIIAEGGITAAATKLRQPKATISRRLQRLEKAVGAPLFDRASRRLRPTLLGEALARPAAAMRVALAGAQSVVDASHSGQGGTLRIAAPFLFGRLVLSPFVGRFLSENPEVQANLKFSNEVVDPLRDEFDIAIQIAEPKESYLIRAKLASAELKLYAAPDVADTIRRIGDLRTQRAINTSISVLQELVFRLGDGHRVRDERLKVICTVNDPEAACFIAARGTGVAALPEFLARSFVEAGELKPVLPGYRLGSVGIYTAMPPGRPGLPIMRKFIAGLRKELSEMRFGK